MSDKLLLEIPSAVFSLGGALQKLCHFCDERAFAPLEAITVSLPGDVFDPIYQEMTGHPPTYGDDGRSREEVIVSGCAVFGWRSVAPAQEAESLT